MTQRIKNILLKEWLVMSTDVNSALFVTVLPLLIVGEGILYIWLAYHFGGKEILNSTIFQTALAKQQLALPAVAVLTTDEQLQVLLLCQFNLFLLLIPTMIAVSFATFSIVDEKLSQSMEPLLATPVRTWELLLGKVLAGAIPALIVTWICAVVFVVGVGGIGWGNLLVYVTNASWFISLFLITPVITVLSFMLGVIGSSRAKDARSAQTLSVFIILPIMALIGIQVTGILWLTPLFTLLLAVAIAVLDYFVLKIAVRLFQRESIILKWR